MATAAVEAGNGTADVPESDAPPSTAAATDAAATIEQSTEPPAPLEASTAELYSAEEAGTEGPSAAAAEGPPPAAAAAVAEEGKRWPGWPGDNVFRMIVPVVKVGSIIGRKGELIKKMCEETRARIRILEGASGTSDRIVLVSGREDPEKEISPAMDAVLRVFKRVCGITATEDEGSVLAATGTAVSSVRLLASSSQAINLIGKGGTLIKSIQEGTGASVRVLSGDEVPFYATSDERIIEIQGDSLKVLKALEAVVDHLRKFLVDHSVIPLFEKAYSTSVTPAPQDRLVDTWADKTQNLVQAASHTGIRNDFPVSLKRDHLFLDRETQLDSQIQRSGLSLYGQDPAVAGLHSSGLGRTAGALITQITQTMQIPLSYAEDIIGVGGTHIAYIRRTSGAILTVQESRGMPNEITVEIKGTSTQVQTAQQLIHGLIAGHKDPSVSSYDGYDTGLRSSYAANASYPSSSTSQSYGGYGSSGVGGYGTSGVGGYGSSGVGGYGSSGVGGYGNYRI